MSITIKGLGQIQQAIRKKETALKQWGSSENMKKVAWFAVNQIVKRTRLGRGVTEKGGSEIPLKKLAPSTIKQRKRESLSSFTRPSKSNLTESGHMLDAITPKIDGKSITLEFDSNTHPGGKISNKRLADIHHNEKGRPFFNFSGKDLVKIYDFIRRAILKPILDKTK